ncbi:MAG: LLM class F420-dependent oxidoreductase [Nocardioides sp.]
MRLGMTLDYASGFEETVEQLVDYETAGLDLIGVAEVYTFDAVSQLGYIAARTKRLELMSSIFQIYTRSPSLTAMTAAGLDYVSGGRFTLGLGASGPQVIEGFHGIKYDAPLARTREVVEICRQVWQRQPVVHEGTHYQVPLTKEHGGSGLGKPLKLINHPVRPRIPVSIAALGPKNVAMVAEIAEGWQPLFFHPQKWESAFGESLSEGAARRDPAMGPLDIQLQVSYSLGEADPEALQAVRDQLALYIGGMGARDKNFYNQLACRYGFESEAKEIQDLYLEGRKSDAATAVPDELVRAVSLIGDEDYVRAHLAEFAAAGVTTLLLKPLATTHDARVADVRRLAELIN